jgi:thiol-disulfide isomerase/thioredoxin
MKYKTEIIVVVIAILILGVISYFAFFNDKEVNNVINKNASLSDIKKEEGMVNIYLFYGKECPHCEKLMEYLDDINDEYGNKFNLYGFEVWHDSSNASLMKKFVTAKGDNSSGVPYYVIGDESFIGYNYTYDEKIVKAIEKYSSNGYDIYFDKIK